MTPSFASKSIPNGSYKMIPGGGGGGGGGGGRGKRCIKFGEASLTTFFYYLLIKLRNRDYEYEF